MTVAIISDTHVPDREDEIPEEFPDLIREADHVVHAGDFTTEETLAEVRELATELTAVHGNMDPEDFGLPTVASVEVEDVTLVVTHGDVVHETDELVRTREDWNESISGTARENGEEPVVGIGGHSHELVDRVYDGIRLLNPGSVTGADPAESATMLTADVADGELDVTVHEV
ncbi:metallophosphoesterase family protein [Halorussus halophilus]|uniref:metallophosphoesterase family protein n=1 Tax=Halorussus halophilus TaxID=2650975 RepID=UPI0013014AEE|nr:metallophosphoesterase family protein [Halorussus halophilus]